MAKTIRVRNKYVAARLWGEQTIERAAIRYAKIHRCSFEKAMSMLHRESRDANERSPSRHYRRMREKRMRTFNNQQLKLALIGELDNAVCKENPDSCLWDWR